MGNLITVVIKQVYGKETIYPACDKSKAFAKLIGQKTLTRQNITDIKSIGFSVEVWTAPTTL